MLLWFAGCTADRHIAAAIFGDEIAFRIHVAARDFGNPIEMLEETGDAWRRAQDGPENRCDVCFGTGIVD